MSFIYLQLVQITMDSGGEPYSTLQEFIDHSIIEERVEDK